VNYGIRLITDRACDISFNEIHEQSTIEIRKQVNSGTEIDRLLNFKISSRNDIFNNIEY